MKKYLLLLLTTLLFFCSCSRTEYKNPHYVIETQMGDVEIELFVNEAPVTTSAFISYIKDGLYKNTSFYRVLKSDPLPSANNTGIIQAGLWNTKNKEKESIPGVNHESTEQTGLTHTTGTLSLARTAPGSASTEFFICIGDQTALDYGRRGTGDGQGFAAFGRVFKGMAVVRKIQDQKNAGDKFVEPVKIKNIRPL